MQETQYKWIREWRAQQPELEKECEHCGSKFRTKFGRLCSPKCRVAAQRARERQQKATALCDLCGKELGGRARRFCSKQHKRRFYTLVRAGREIPVKVSAATTIWTRKYDDIQGVRQRWLDSRNNRYT